MKRKENIYDRQYRNAGLQLCQEIFGTNDLEELKEIADKAQKYDLILQTSRPGNLRGAGRKAKFSQEQLKEICELHQEGVSVQKIAEQFHTSRQTIYKYLAAHMEQEREQFTLRINYLEEYTVCSVIDVDEKHRRVSVSNRVKDYSKCAFGALEEPTWEALEWFLESRCFPRDADDVEERLQALGLKDYEPMKIVEKTKGRLETDHQWLQLIRLEG